MKYTHSIQIKSSQVLPPAEHKSFFKSNYKYHINALNEMLLDMYKNHFYIAPMIQDEKEDTEVLTIHYEEPIDLIMLGKAIVRYRAKVNSKRKS